MDFLLLEPLRAAATQIDRILLCFMNLMQQLLVFSNNNYFKLVIDTIINNDYLLISVSLLIIGFVIGIIKRIISI